MNTATKKHLVNRAGLRAACQAPSVRRALIGCLAAMAASFCLSGAQGATLTVTSLADSGTGSLRDAIVAANASVDVDDTINFRVSGTIVLGERLPAIADDVTIDGTGQDITVSGNNAVQVLFVGAGKKLDLIAIKIASGSCAAPCSGGAILNVGTLKVTACTFTGNSAFLGGAIHNFGVLEVNGSHFSGNSARIGGAIHNFYRLAVRDSIFSGNSAALAGGAIHNFDMFEVMGSNFTANSVAGTRSDVQNLGSMSFARNVREGTAMTAENQRKSGGDDHTMLTITGGTSVP